jgi:hypothetical protein
LSRCAQLRCSLTSFAITPYISLRSIYCASLSLIARRTNVLLCRSQARLINRESANEVRVNERAIYVVSLRSHITLRSLLVATLHISAALRIFTTFIFARSLFAALIVHYYCTCCALSTKCVHLYSLRSYVYLLIALLALYSLRSLYRSLSLLIAALLLVALVSLINRCAHIKD